MIDMLTIETESFMWNQTQLVYQQLDEAWLNRDYAEFHRFKKQFDMLSKRWRQEADKVKKQILDDEL